MMLLAALLVCARCHPEQAGTQPDTPMAHALETVADCRILKSNALLEYRSGAYAYTIRRQGDASVYTVSDGRETLSEPIGWAFGNGAAGQTYVFQHNGALYESRVSFYNALNGLDRTMGAPAEAPRNLLEAAGRRMDPVNARECFGCHSTNAVEGKTLALDQLVPGVQCEHCHGSAEQHLKALAPMRKLSALSTEEVSNFCGQCHRTWEQIAAQGPRGAGNVRFQPYRLTNSKCYDAADRRIACTACHDPHRQTVRQARAYDAKCRACHGGGKPAARACRVARQDCSSCHMPKTPLPGAHFAFADHWIRISKAGEAYPE